MYGGRVTDDYDRRVIVNYLEEYMGDFLFDSNNKYFFAKTKHYNYELPVYADVDEFMKNAQDLLMFDPLEVFGLNSNAEILYLNNSARQLSLDLLNLQVMGGGFQNIEEKNMIILKISEEILSNIEPEFDVQKYTLGAGADIEPILVVLLQEMDRYNKLTAKMIMTMKDLQRAFKGEIGMNAELEVISNQLYNG